MRLTVRTKLFGGFGIVVALMVLLGLLAIAKMGTIKDGGEFLAKGTIPSVEIMGQLSGNAEDYRKNQFRLATASNEETFAEAEGNLAENNGNLEKAIKAYEPLLEDARDRELWEEFPRNWKAYLDASAAFVAEARAGNVEAAAQILNDADKQFDVVAKTIADWWEHNDVLAAKRWDQAEDSYSGARRLTIVLILLSVAIAGGLAFLIARQITSGVAQALRAAQGIADGDVEQTVDIRTRDELGDMGTAFGRMVEYLKGLAGVAGRVADGDLTVEVEPRSERDLLGTSFRTLVHDLRSIVGNVSSTAGAVGAASQQMASTSEEAGRAVGEIASAVGEVAAGAERQVRQVESVKGSADQAAIAARSSAEKAQQAAEVAAQARETAGEGVQAAAEASVAMRAVSDSSGDVTAAIQGLASKSQEIGTIVETITGIAGQTNLLALNAAIEAARAGEQGRGFAVVAEEVRKLAEGSQEAAEQIAQLVEQVQGETRNVVAVVEDGARRTEDGAAVVERTREAFERIGSAVDEVTGRIEDIAGAAQQISAEADKVTSEVTEVAAVAEQSSASSEQVSASTQQTSASTQEIAASAQQLARTADELNELIGQFKLDTEELAVA